MLWSSKPNAGFCHQATEPWLPIAENFSEINVEKQMADPHSLFSFYKKVIRLRKKTPALYEGSLEIARDLCNRKILAYYRVSNGAKYLILLNMSRSLVRNPVNNVNVLLSTHLQGEAHQLQPFEGRAIRLG